MPIPDYNISPNLNTQISGINIAENCPPGNMNNAIRQMMSDVKAFYDNAGGGTVLPATESRSGKVELATSAEAVAGLDATRAVHPAGLKAAMAAGTAKAATTATKLTTPRTIDLSGLVAATATAFDGSANITIPVTAVSQANKLATARSISLSGGASGAASFDGSANISIPVTGLDISKATAGVLPVARGGTGRADGKAPSLVTARTISISGGVTGTSVPFDGSANVSISVTGLDVGKATAGVLSVARGGTGVTTGVAPKPTITAGAVGDWKMITGNTAYPRGDLVLPAGGTWAYIAFSNYTDPDSYESTSSLRACSIAAGGTTIVNGANNITTSGFCWRIA